MAGNLLDRAQLGVFVFMATILAFKVTSAGMRPQPEGGARTSAGAPASQVRRGLPPENGILATSSPPPLAEPAAAVPLSSETADPAAAAEDAAAVASLVPRGGGDEGAKGGAQRSRAATAVQGFAPLGCGVLGPRQEHSREQVPNGTTALPEACHRLCRRKAYRFFGLAERADCWCSDTLDHVEVLRGPDNTTEEACRPARRRHTLLFRVDGEFAEIITMYIAPAKRTSSLFMSGRLERFFSGRYAYRYRRLNAQVFRSDAKFREEVCTRTPGKKIFVQIAGSVTYLLQHWPDRSVLIMTADEIGNWGLGADEKRFGPHGPGQPFASNESSELKHAILPDRVYPIFKQYFHFKQYAAFGDRMRFVPLGSRTEYPDVPPGSIVPAHKRTLVYSYMAALTDETRRKVHTLLVQDTTIPADKRFIHVSQNWHGTANNEEYVSPERYHEVMLSSVFAICPKGHSVEQFRIYEAIEAGAIPVMDLKSGYLRQHLPAEYLESPMLLLDGWDTVVVEMRRLWQDPKALLERQQKLLAWYDGYMRQKVVEIESALEARELEKPGFCRNAS